MPFDEPDAEDPMLLVGVALPGGPESQRDMACVFAEEFARLGYGRDRILALFREPFYAGAHGALRALGETEIVRIVDETVAVWGGGRS